MKRTIAIPLHVFVIVIVILLLVTGLVEARQLGRGSLIAGAPTVVNYTGKITVNGAPHDKDGYFKFAVVNAVGNTSYWSNDGSSTIGDEPASAVVLPVNKGLFNVLLGETSLPGMTQPLSAVVFSGTQRYLRVWFSSDGASYQQLDPDQRFAAVPYALQAQQAVDADTVDGQHASQFGLPAGAMVLSITDSDNALIAAGFSYTGQWFDAWNTRAKMLTEHYYHGAAAVNGMIHVFGGMGSMGSLTTHEAYDPTSDSWSTRAPMLIGREQMVVAVVDGVIYAIGGNESSTVQAYYPITDTWVLKSPMPTGRSDMAAAVVDGIIYVIGGTTPGNSNVTVNEAYDPATDTWATKAPLPIGRTALAAAAVDGIVYAIGGGSEITPNETVNLAYDPVANHWTSKANLPQGLCRGYTAVIDGLVYVLGESPCTDSGQLGHLVYNPATDSWSSRTPTQYHFGFAMAAVDRSIYLLGGGNPGSNYGNEIYIPPLYIYRKD